jgi:hypothetical protein
MTTATHSTITPVYLVQNKKFKTLESAKEFAQSLANKLKQGQAIVNLKSLGTYAERDIWIEPNPAVSAAQYGMAQAVLNGASTGMPVAVARELIQKTPAKLRKKYAEELAGNRNPQRLPIGDMDWTTFDSRQAAKTYARLAEGEGKEAVVQGTIGGKWDVGTWSRKSNPSAKLYPKRRPIGKYLAVAYGYSGLRSREVADTEHEAALKALKAALPEVEEITVYKILPDHDAPVGLYGKDTLDALAREHRKGKSNPEDTAADMYASFHGTPSEEILEIEEQEHYHSHLAELGILCGVTVETIHGKFIAIGFNGYVYRQGSSKKDTGFVLGKGKPNPWFGFGSDITEKPHQSGKHSAWTVSRASREAYKAGFKGEENFHDWLSKNHLDGRSDGLKKILSKEYGNGVADEEAGAKLKPGQASRSIKTEAVEPGKATRHLGNKIKVERTTDGKFHILGIPGKKFDSFTDAYQFVAQNPSADRFLLHSKELSLSPPNEDGIVNGPYQRISHGTRIEVMRKGPRHRSLIKGDFFGVPFYGWADDSNIGTLKSYRNAHDADPEGLQKNPKRRKGPFGEALKAGRDAAGAVDSAIGDVFRNPSDTYTDQAYGNKYEKRGNQWFILKSHRSPGYVEGSGWERVDKSESKFVQLMVDKGKLVKANPSDATTADTTLLCSNESGTSLYLEGGDQSLDLASLGFPSDLTRDSMVIGECVTIYYETQKDFDKFEITQYYHEFGVDEDTKVKVERPQLRYDNMNGKQYLDGGAYVIKKPVFGTSRGIEK